MPLIAYVMLGTMGLIWGSSYLFVDLGLRSITPFTLAAMRVICGTVFLVTVTYLAGHRLPRLGKAWIFPAIIGFTGNALPFVMIANGQVHVSISLTAILISAVPLFTLVLAHFFSDDRFTTRKVVGALIGFGGIVLLFGPAAFGGISAHIWGQLMMLVAAMGFAITTVVARHMRGLNALVSASQALICAAIYTVPLAFIVEQPLTVRPEWISLGAVLFIGVVATGGAYLIFFRLTAIAGPNFVAMNNYISPAVGVMWGVVLAGDILGWEQIIAIALIFVGIAIATFQRRLASPASTG